VGGLPAVVSPEAGSLHPVGDAEGMGEAALAFLSDDVRWTRASEAARSVAVERFSVERVVPVYEDWYRRIVAGEGGA
jgi:L-malate glycosyltransferase